MGRVYEFVWGIQIWIDSGQDQASIPNKPVKILREVRPGTKENKSKKQAADQQEPEIPFFKLNQFGAHEKQGGVNGQETSRVGPFQKHGESIVKCQAGNGKQYWNTMESPISIEPGDHQVGFAVLRRTEKFDELPRKPCPAAIGPGFFFPAS